VDYTGFSQLNPSRFGQSFVGRVANPKEILNFHRKTKTKLTSTANNPEEQLEEEEALFSRAVRPEVLDTTKIEDLILSFLGPSGAVEILPETDFTNALNNFVEKEEKTAISEFIKKKIQSTQKFLEAQEPSKTKTLDDIQSLVIEQTSKQKTIDSLKRKEKQKENTQNEVISTNTEKITPPPLKKPKIKKEKSEKSQIINVDEDDMFMLDEKQSKKVKIKQEKSSQSLQSKKRDLTKLDDFVAPSAPAPKKSKNKTVKEEEIIPSSSSRKLIGNLLDESQSHESESTKSVRTAKWGRKKS